jgi:hypothetical protein
VDHATRRGYATWGDVFAETAVLLAMIVRDGLTHRTAPATAAL